MMYRDHLKAMAAYNAWMNGNLLDAAGRLDAAAVAADRGAFFGSILGTFNHLAVTDLIWLRRLAGHPSGGDLGPALAGLPTPTRLDERPYDSLDHLRPDRVRLDGIIADYVAGLDTEALATPLAYRRMNGQGQVKALTAVLSHLFNHQTHHRGQITTLLFQAGVDPGTTDLIAMIPDVA